MLYLIMLICYKLMMDDIVQWILAYTGCFSTEDSCSWLGHSTAIHPIGMYLR